MTSSTSNSNLNREIALQLTRPPWTNPKTYPGTSKFSRLPLELRNMIWDWSLAHSRVVWIKLDSESKTQTGHDMEHPHCHVPSILQINRESRSYGLRYYSLAFAPSPDKSRCYFNYNLHWAYFNPAEAYYDREGIPRRIINSGFHDITRLYLEEFNFWGPLQHRHFEDLDAFSKLDTIFIYNRDHGSAKFIPNCVFPPRDGAVEDLLIRVLE